MIEAFIWYICTSLKHWNSVKDSDEVQMLLVYEFSFRFAFNSFIRLKYLLSTVNIPWRLLFWDTISNNQAKHLGRLDKLSQQYKMLKEIISLAVWERFSQFEAILWRLFIEELCNADVPCIWTLMWNWYSLISFKLLFSYLLGTEASYLTYSFTIKYLKLQIIKMEKENKKPALLT